VDKSECQKIVDENLRHLARALGLWDWGVDIEYGPISGSSDDFAVIGQCNPRIKYKQAHINLDNNLIESEEKLLEVLTHELIHIFHAGYLICWETCDELLTPNERAAITPSIRFGHESTVLCVETMLRTMKMTPQKMIEFAKNEYGDLYEDKKGE